MIRHLIDHIEAWRVKFDCVRSVNNGSAYKEGMLPRFPEVANVRAGEAISPDP